MAKKTPESAYRQYIKNKKKISFTDRAPDTKRMSKGGTAYNNTARSKTINKNIGKHPKQDNHKQSISVSKGVRKQQQKSYNQTSGGRFTQGFVKNSVMGGLPKRSTATYKDSNNKKKKVAESKAYKAGEIIGDIVSYGTGYGLVGKAITRATGKAVAKQALKEGAEQAARRGAKQAAKKSAIKRAEDTVATKAGQAILKGEAKVADKMAKSKVVDRYATRAIKRSEDAAKLASSKGKDAVKKDVAANAARKLSRSLIADATAGTALDTAHAHGEGIDIGLNKEYLSYMGTNAAMNLGMGGAFEAVGAGGKALKRFANGRASKAAPRYETRLVNGKQKRVKVTDTPTETVRKAVVKRPQNRTAMSNGFTTFNRGSKNKVKIAKLKQAKQYAKNNDINIKEVIDEYNGDVIAAYNHLYDLSAKRVSSKKPASVDTYKQAKKFAEDNNIDMSKLVKKHNGDRVKAIKELNSRRLAQEAKERDSQEFRNLINERREVYNNRKEAKAKEERVAKLRNAKQTRKPIAETPIVRPEISEPTGNGKQRVKLRNSDTNARRSRDPSTVKEKRLSYPKYDDFKKVNSSQIKKYARTNGIDEDTAARTLYMNSMDAKKTSKKIPMEDKIKEAAKYGKENNIKFSEVLEEHNGNRVEAIDDLYNRSTAEKPKNAPAKRRLSSTDALEIESRLRSDDPLSAEMYIYSRGLDITDDELEAMYDAVLDNRSINSVLKDENIKPKQETKAADTPVAETPKTERVKPSDAKTQKAKEPNAEVPVSKPTVVKETIATPERGIRGKSAKVSAKLYAENPNRADIVSLRERPTRPTGDSGEVSQAAETIRDSNIQTEESRKRAQEIIDEGLRNKRFKSNAKAIEEAEAKINERGADDVARSFENDVDDGYETTSERIAEAYVCYKHYIDNGEFAKANELGERIVITESEHGRALQAMRLFSSLTPDGRVNSIQRMLRKLNKQRGTDAKVSDELYKALRDAKTETELINANNAISKHVWDQIPANWVEKLNAWRYLAMLGNPKTHGRNVVGNIVFYPVRAMRNVMATGMEKAALKTKKGSELLTGERTKAILTGSREDKELVRMGKDSFNSGVGEILRGNAKYLDTSDGMTLAVRPHESQVFNTKWLDWLRKKNGEWLDREDLAFMRPTYAKSYASYLKANGYTAKTATEEALKKAQDYASGQALEATYRDYNFLATKLNKYKRYANTPLKDIPANSQSPDAERLFKKAAGIGVEALAPFTKTPINILRRGADFSPIGLAQGVGKLMKASSADELVRGIEKLSSGLTGTGIMALGYSLGHMGVATGSLDYTDKKDVYAQTMGKQAYSIEIGDNSFTIDTLAPISMPFFVGVELAKGNDENGSLASAFSSFDKITDPIFNLSMLSSLNNAFSNRYSASNSVTEFVKQSGESYLGQFLPTIGSQAARTIQKETTSTTATDSDTTIRNYHRFINQMKNKVPFLADTNAPKVDQWGRTETKEDAMDYATAAFQNFVNPSNYKRIKTNKADKEIQKLLEQGADASVIPNSKPQSYKVVFGNKEVQMSADDVANMQKKVGRTALKSLKELFDSDAYKNMTLEEKEKAVSNVYTDAKSIAKHEFLINKGYSPVSVAWKLDLNDDQRDGFGSKAEFKKALKKANITAEEYSKLAQEGMTPSKLKSANSKGISAKAFLGYTKLKAEDKGGYASQAMYLYRNGLAKDADSAYENYDIRKATYEAAVQMVDAGYTEDEIYELTGNVDDVVKDIKENYGHDTWSNGVEVVSAEGLKKYLDSRKELTDNDRHNLWYIYGLGHDWFKAKNPY